MVSLAPRDGLVYADAGCFLTFFARFDFISAVLKALKGRIAVNCSLIFLTANFTNFAKLAQVDFSRELS